MNKTKITMGFGKMSDDALEGYTASIVASMTGNKNFPDVNPSLATLTDASKAYSDALIQAKTRHRTSVAVKNARRTELEQLLRDMAHYCSFVAQGDRSILVSSGFMVNAETRVAKTLLLPANFTIEPGVNSGQVIASASRVSNARSYLFLYAPSPVENDNWLHSSTSLPYCSISGLTPGKMYSFKICVTGARGEVLYTEPISKVVPW